MDSIKLFYSLLLFLLLNTHLNAKMYEDAEDKNVIRWNILSSSKEGTVRISYDKTKKSNVIKFEGERRQSSYILPLDDTNNAYPSYQKILFQWEMQYHKDYLILIRINTLKGVRTLIYTSRSIDKPFQYKLGKNSISSQWKKYTRNIRKDLQQYEPDNQLLSLQSFVIRGNGKVDNIQLIEEKPIKIKKPQPKKIPKINIPLPTIKLQGENPLILKKGEAYIEMGAKAYDVNGSELDISISSNVNIHIDGEYTVMYITTNSIGNSAVDKRIVRVGKVPIQKEPIIEEEEDAEEVDIKQISPLKTTNKLADEKDFFDKALSKTKKIIHPSHPGL